MDSEPKKTIRLPRRFQNWISLGGFVISLGALFAFLLLFAIDLFAHQGNPYMGILAYVVAPGFFFLGMFLALGGAWIHRKKSGATAEGEGPPEGGLLIDFSRTRDRAILGVFIGISIFFLFLTALGSYRTYHYTESVHFCGQACHTPMKPEFTTYLNSPHARVACTDCHVGPGVTWYFKAKINGVHQLYCTLTDTFERPIKTPVKNLRPAQDTCEQCHWPNRYAGNLDKTYQHFLADETNTPFTVRLSLKVGGGDPKHGPVGGIHWHMNLSNKVEYIATDARRQVIPWVRVTDPSGRQTEYRTAEFQDDISKHTIRTMDCMDCHNRPAHQFRTPNEAVDQALAAGRIDASIPWVKSNVVSVLIQPYSTEAEALQKIAASLRQTYAAHPKVEGLISEAQQIFRGDFFPEMKADWRAYPSNISHKDWPGCFRCHDGKHKTADGSRSIQASDCNSCHTILAQGSGEQLNQLSATGHTFFHIDAEYTDFSCTDCHTGAFPK